MTPAQARVVVGGKVNLYLRVMPRRPDGFHPIESVFHGVSIADTVDLSERPRGVEVTMSPEHADADGDDNLAYLAAAALLDPADPGVRIAIEKRIPIGGGMGGGSADAAAVLIALNQVRRLGRTSAELARIALGLGSDVPYFLRGGTQLVTGRGEVLEPVACPRPLHLVLGISEVALSTASVYEVWDEIGTTGDRGPAEMIAALASGDPASVARCLANDLEPAAFHLRPDVVVGKDALLRAGALGALVSGSGPTVFAVAENEEHARNVAARASGAFARVEVVATRASAQLVEG